MKDYFTYNYLPKVSQSICVFDNSLENYITDITIAIPTFDRSKMLTESLRSVIDAYENFNKIKIEVIIIDNYPESKSFDYLKTKIDIDNLNFSFKYFKNTQNVGMFGNWNRAIELSTSKLITILNDDDLFDKEILKHLHPFLKKELRLYLFQYKTLNQNISNKRNQTLEALKKYKFLSSSSLKLNDYYWGMPSMGSLGVFFERDTALQLGAFPEHFYPINDWVFFAKYINEVKVGLIINKPLVYYRIATNESMKPEVADMSLREAFNFRLFLGKMLKIKLNVFFSKMFVLIRIHGNKRIWNIATDLKKYSKEFNIYWYHHTIFHIFRFAIFIKKLI